MICGKGSYKAECMTSAVLSRAPSSPSGFHDSLAVPKQFLVAVCWQRFQSRRHHRWRVHITQCSRSMHRNVRLEGRVQSTRWQRERRGRMASSSLGEHDDVILGVPTNGRLYNSQPNYVVSCNLSVTTKSFGSDLESQLS
jgi:hypothetical protein